MFEIRFHGRGGEGRYRSFKEQDLQKIEEKVRKEWEYLLRMAG